MYPVSVGISLPVSAREELGEGWAPRMPLGWSEQSQVRGVMLGVYLTGPQGAQVKLFFWYICEAASQPDEHFSQRTE